MAGGIPGSIRDFDNVWLPCDQTGKYGSYRRKSILPVALPADCHNTMPDREVDVRDTGRLPTGKS